MKKEKIVSAEQALNLISDHDHIAISAAGLVGYPDYIVKCLEERFLSTGHPSALHLYAGCGHGVPYLHQGDQRFGHEGFLKRVICSHPDVVPELRMLIETDKLEAYVLPQGVLQHLYRCSASHEPGLLTKIGIGTYIDPRQDGGKLNRVTRTDIVHLMTIDEEEYLFYQSFPVQVAIIRGTTADEDGNVTIEHEALKLEILELALAAKANHGVVIVQVERVAARNTLPPKEVVIPGELVDAVVVTERPEEYHRATAGTVYSSYMSGEVRCPPAAAAPPKTELAADDIICRRALFELYPGAIVNVGVGIGAGIGPAAALEGIQDKVKFTLELGVFGGIPQQGKDFGVAVNPTSFLSHTSMFDFYHGGGLNITFLGAAQIDRNGNVNVSKFAGRAAGQGGFIDISQTAQKVVFCTYFKAKGFRSSISNGSLSILQEGTIPKFVEHVDQITFNGTLARQRGAEVYFITERCVFLLKAEGLTLVEIAPGIDLQRDILDQMSFRPAIDPELRTMDVRIFQPGRMGCFDSWNTV